MRPETLSLFSSLSVVLCKALIYADVRHQEKSLSDRCSSRERSEEQLLGFSAQSIIAEAVVPLSEITTTCLDFTSSTGRKRVLFLRGNLNSIDSIESSCEGIALNEAIPAYKTGS